MRSIPAALFWEFLKRGKWILPGAFLTGNALALVLLICRYRTIGRSIRMNVAWSPSI